AVGVHDRDLTLRIGTSPWTTIGGFALLVLALGGGAALVTGGAFEARYAGVVVAFTVVLVARAI
ncbi:MAG: hypothetical protein GWN79_18170, partial [Actinobacteria bacterium]|nr:hypothetical protein [Actinomycetota bacterium]NIS34018.1 hypothetical protein [Actinomycetota bacterium]NIT97203.1 hypothetical protein [Actinomycetota bacterium]NIU20880.1 hypothetical protein [Actinomycetota bacterium]NIU68825.1 hypothetical protein [Actinomycetota bacterium]